MYKRKLVLMVSCSALMNGVIIKGNIGGVNMNEYVKGLTFENIIGKIILVGVTIKNKNGDLLGYKQFHGIVIQADANKGITIKNESNQTYNLPPDLNFFVAAEPGEYREKESGIVISDPDYITQWISTKSDT
jgi:hypothetical protein